MLTFYEPGQKGAPTETLEMCRDLTQRSLWIDVYQPTREEELALEAALGIDVPTREEMQEIELSRRLYVDGPNLFMTATVLAKADSSHPESAAVTFILMPERLVTLRYSKSVAFQVFSSRWSSQAAEYTSSAQVFAGAVDAMVERLADILENTSAGIDRLSLEVFGGGPEPLTQGPAPSVPPPANPEKPDYKAVLQRIGRHSDLASRARESLVSIGRLVSFFRDSARQRAPAQEVFEHLNSVRGDIESLTDHATFLSGKVSFLLDATLGLISNEQNGIIKIVSVAAVVFLPPTLVASIYGMNFEHMPELKWQLGYPLALAMMVVFGVLPYAFFKRKGWL